MSARRCSRRLLIPETADAGLCACLPRCLRLVVLRAGSRPMTSPRQIEQLQKALSDAGRRRLAAKIASTGREQQNSGRRDRKTQGRPGRTRRPSARRRNSLANMRKRPQVRRGKSSIARQGGCGGRASQKTAAVALKGVRKSCAQPRMRVPASRTKRQFRIASANAEKSLSRSKSPLGKRNSRRVGRETGAEADAKVKKTTGIAAPSPPPWTRRRGSKRPRRPSRRRSGRAKARTALAASAPRPLEADGRGKIAHRAGKLESFSQKVAPILVNAAGLP